MLIGLTTTAGNLMYFNTDHIVTAAVGPEIDGVVLELANGETWYIRGSLNEVLIEIQGS